ncbi:MAG TPA: phosphotransferase, partial [Actinomycetota bacterium]|nr:phosphotransferase [Actinomycetota bacterium]
SEVRPVQVLYRPGRSCLVRFRSRAEHRDGRRRVFTLCAESRARDRALPPPSATASERADLAEPVGSRDGYRIWAFPYDPGLAGLAEAASGERVRRSLADLGRHHSAVHAEAVRYRPRRRAVFRYRALSRDRGRRWDRAYGKVISPADVRRGLGIAASVHGSRRIRLVLPAGRLGEDVLLFDEAPGTSLRDLLVRGGSLPRPERIAALLDELPAAVGSAELPTAPDPGDRARSAASLVERLVPAAGPGARRVADHVAAAARRFSPRVVHGDLYEAQILVGEDFSLSLVDLDDLAIGDPAVDAGSFCAHLVALALSAPSARGRLVAYRSLARAAFLVRLGLSSPELAWREALRMLLLAPGPFRTLHPQWPREVRHRVDLAVRLLEVPEA